jgi:hypothetical protein
MAKSAAPKVATQATLGSLAKAEADRKSAITELAKAAEGWESRAREYGLDPDMKAYLVSKARAARDEIARLEGRAVPEVKQVTAAKAVTVTLPR